MTCENGVLCRKCNFPRSAVYIYPYLIFSSDKRSENFFNFIYPVGDILSYRMYSCFEVSGEFRGDFDLSTVRCAVKRNTSTRRQAAISQANEMSDFTSKMKRQRNETTSQARRNGVLVNMWRNGCAFWVKLRFAQWSKALRLRYFFCPIWGKKNGVVDRTWTGDLLGHNQTR